MTTYKKMISRRGLLAAIPMLAMPVFPAISSPGNEATPVEGQGAQHSGKGRRIGLALGAGGANGLAHIEMLEVLEKMGLHPYRIAGSSIGAVVGALFASGMSAAEIRELANSAFVAGDRGLLDPLISEQAMQWLDFVELEVGSGGLLDSQRILSHFYHSISTTRFTDLDVRLDVVAGDLWGQEQVVLNSGLLLPAVQASMAIPGIFEPVHIDGRMLIDGGTVNPVPWDLLFEDCGIVIAIDVSGVRSRSMSGEFGYFEILFNSVKVMQNAIIGEKMRHRKPDIFIAPQIRDIRALEFYNAAAVFEQAKPAKEQLERELSNLLAA
jgi:NTE family protein